MRVRFTVDYVVPGCAHCAGVIAEIPDAEAQRVIAKGEAEAVTETAAVSDATAEKRAKK